MQYLMFTYFNEGIASRWEELSTEDQAAEIQAHLDWFNKHGERIRGGHELAWPRTTAAIRGGSEPVIVDGPYLETKEILGGVIVLEAKTLDDAVAIAREWPSLEHDGALVEVVPRHQRDSCPDSPRSVVTCREKEEW